ncbi:hypothetical protein JW824_07665 [bacterium]|nr:hypothetical protein [bacterium]
MFSFTVEELLLAFERYNLAVWPLQIIASILGLVALFFTIKKTKNAIRIVSAILSFFWLWTGIVFCFIYWSPYYSYAYGFGILCVIQGLLFLISTLRPDLSDHSQTKLDSTVGFIFIIYSMAGYLVLGYLIGHGYPKYLPFGLVPCPTAIFTFGLFLMIDKKFPRYYLIVPSIIAIVSLLAIYKGIYEDIGLFLAGLIGTFLILKMDRKYS